MESWGRSHCYAIAFYSTALVVHEGQTVLVTRYGRPVRRHASGAPLEAPLAHRPHLARHATTRLRGWTHRNAHARQEEHRSCHTYKIISADGDVLAFAQSIGEGARRKGSWTACSRTPQSAPSANTISQPSSPRMKRTCRWIRSKPNYLPGLRQQHVELWGRIESGSSASLSRGEREGGVQTDARRAPSVRGEVPGGGEREAVASRPEADEAARRSWAQGTEQAAKMQGSRPRKLRSMADAHRVNQELYPFTRSLESLGQLVTPDTSFVLQTDAEPFSLLQGKESK